MLGVLARFFKEIDGWCDTCKFDKKIVTYRYISSREGERMQQGGFDFEAAIELYKEHEEEDK